MHIIDILHDKLFDTKNQVITGYGVLCGWTVGIYSLLHTPNLGVVTAWDFIIKTSAGIIISVITTLCILIITDLYKHYKPKAIVFIKTKKGFLIIKFYKRNGKINKDKAA